MKKSSAVPVNNLVELLQQGSEAAFTGLYDQYSQQLYRNILRLVKDEQIAQELLQDLFLKIWDIREDIDPQRSFQSFLYKIAENLVYAHFRKVAMDRRLMVRLVATAIDFDPHAEDDLIFKENYNLLKKAIEKLSPQRKQVYTLCKLEGKSYEEVSAELGISTSTIRDHIVKANRSVKKYFSLNQDMAVILLTSALFFKIK